MAGVANSTPTTRSISRINAMGVSTEVDAAVRGSGQSSTKHTSTKLNGTKTRYHKADLDDQNLVNTMLEFSQLHATDSPGIQQNTQSSCAGRSSKTALLNLGSLHKGKREDAFVASKLSSQESTTKITDGENKVVLYFTSLRGVRRTYDDCRAVRMIFAGFHVPIDERDVSLESSYRKEIQDVLGKKVVTLPHIFIRGKHVGGANEVRELNESGELVKILQGLPLRKPRTSCKACCDGRFIPCTVCNGSRKVFLEDTGQWKRCSNCNENGLVRCLYCDV